MSYPTQILIFEDALSESVGRMGGFDNFKKIIKDAKHPEHKFYREWSAG